MFFFQVEFEKKMALIFLYLNWIPASCLLQPLNDLLLTKVDCFNGGRWNGYRYCMIDFIMQQQVYVLWRVCFITFTDSSKAYHVLFCGNFLPKVGIAKGPSPLLPPVVGTNSQLFPRKSKVGTSHKCSFLQTLITTMIYSIRACIVIYSSYDPMTNHTR